MRHFSSTALLVLSVARLALAAPSPIYENPGVVTAPPTVDAVIFNNSGIFEAYTGITFSNLTTSAEILATPFPYATRDTLYFINTGTMYGIPGFRFDTATATTRFSALDVANHGTVIGEDIAAVPVAYAAPGAATGSTPATTSVPQYSQPQPSQVLIFSTNVVNDGEIGVGNAGVLQIVAKNFTNAHGALAAGGVNTGGSTSLTVSGKGVETETDPLDTTGRGTIEAAEGYYVNPPYVYDLLWGSTNGGQLKVDQLAGELPQTPAMFLGYRGLDGAVGIGTSEVGGLLGNYASYVYTFNSDPTNIYYEIVLLNTNFADTNITVNVEYTQDLLNTPPFANAGDPLPPALVVQYAVSTTDVLTGDTVTNAIYLIDSGAKLTNVVELDNASTANNYDRPMCFEVTTVTPFEWEDGLALAQSPFDPGVIYTPGEFVNNSVPFIAGEYGVQIGRNPETLDGSFGVSLTEALTGTNVTVIEDQLLLSTGLVLPDPTNEAGRIEITAGQADLTSARIRAEGIVMLNITNLIGAGTGASDWGMTDASIGMTNGDLVLANLLPTSFQRVRGQLDAWSATWQNVFTNALTTNNYHMHVLVVDQVLRGNFRPSVRNLTLTGASTVNVQNNLTVINQATFNTSNLVLSANVTLTQGAGNLYPATVPKLTSLVINPNASLTVDSVLDIGYNLTLGQTSPIGRAYTVSSIANFGTIAATAPLFQSAFFLNDGIIFAETNGSIAINASQLALGSLAPGATNYLVAGGNITLSAQSIEATNSEIIAGALTFDVTSNITDNVPLTPGLAPGMVNYWQVSAGFNMPVNPAAGNLLGTEIRTTSSGYNVSSHVWAGVDYPNDPVAGFANNVVIGHLVLDRLTNTAVLSFSGTGTGNAMYVDYLELADFSYSDYRHGLIIDTNSIKIYFANANADPYKLMDIYPGGLIWVSNALATNSTPSGSSRITTPVNVPLSLKVSANGQGKVGPSIISKQLVAGGVETLTATPATGWTFDGWTASGIAAGADLTSPVLKFTVTGAAVVTGNFIKNPFGPLQGVYNGLFLDPSSVSAASAGFFTLTLNSSGAFSGRLLMGPTNYTFSSQFYGSGSRQVQAVNGKQSLTVNLQLQVSGAVGQISGDVNGGTWDSPLTANLAPVWTAKNPSPLAGNYTMVLPGPVLPDYASIGDSFGVVNVSALGVLSVAGSLADGSGFSQSVPVSGGQWPFYSYVASGKDTVIGWVDFSAGVPVAPDLTWIKAPTSGPYYAGGFDTVVEMSGSPYVPPAKKAPVLSLTDPTVIVTGGDLTEDFSSALTLQKTLGYASGDVTLSFTNSTGAFSGKFGPGQTMQGVVLQNQNSARGFFLGTNQSGAVLLRGN